MHLMHGVKLRAARLLGSRLACEAISVRWPEQAFETELLDCCRPTLQLRADCRRRCRDADAAELDTDTTGQETMCCPQTAADCCEVWGVSRSIVTDERGPGPPG